MKILKNFLITMFVFTGLCLIKTTSYSAYQKEGIQNFPDTYKPYLLELQNRHPNWRFIALYPDLDWQYVINNENKFGKNLVPKSYSDRWKNTTTGQYNVEVDAGWVDSSRMAIEYTMDPRNFLNEVRIFQFEGLSYDEKTNNLNGIEKILYGTEFYNRIVDYYTNSGEKVNMTSKYSDLILSAGITSEVSPYHLASRIKQEVGPFLSHSSISGTVPGFEGLYNFYNIGATSSNEPLGAIKNGLQYAKDGKGASQTIKNKYLIPWNTKQKAITGGGIFIGSSYINGGQNTLYLQKFHVVSNSGSNELFWHQYMTNVLAPYSESVAIYNGYANTGMLSNSMTFIIPVYNNMPDNICISPNILESDFVEDNTKVYADVNTTLNIRTGPSTSYESLIKIDRNVIMTRIAKGIQSGELWDKVLLTNGMVGYAFQNYLKEVPNIQIEKINLSLNNTVMKKGESQKIQVEILPKEASNNKIEYSSSNNNVLAVDSQGNIMALKSGTATITVKSSQNDVSSSIEIKVYTPLTDMQVNAQNIVLQEEDSFTIIPIIIPKDADNKNISYESENNEIATVDSFGQITAIKEGKTKVIIKTQENSIIREIQITVVKKLNENEVIFKEPLRVEQNQVTGWDIDKMYIDDIKDKIQTEYTIKIYDINENELAQDKKAGTGCKIRLIDQNNIVKMEYYILIYGDVDGDGKINSFDLLVLQRHILEIEMLKGIFIKAADISKEGRNPSAYDSLVIQRHILGLKSIEQ